MRVQLRTRVASPFIVVCAIALQAAQGAGVEHEWERLLEASDPAVFTAASPSFLMAWASRYENGVHVGRDYARARQLYCAAARRGHTPAQVRLAWMYVHGLGTPRDRELAGAWLRVAAAQGNLEGRRFLALLGYPPRGREPRCTYERRVEQYAGIKGSPSSRHGPVVGGNNGLPTAGN